MYKKILLAYDGSDAGQKALLDCQDLAQWSQSEVFLIAVMPSAMSFVGLEGGVYDIELEEREKKKHQAVLQALFGASVPTLETVFDRLADVVEAHFETGVLPSLLAC